MVLVSPAQIFCLFVSGNNLYEACLFFQNLDQLQKFVAIVFIENQNSIFKKLVVINKAQ